MKDGFEIFKANYTHLINHKHGCSFFSDMIGSDNCDCGIMKEMWVHIQKDLQAERKKTLEEVRKIKDGVEFIERYLLENLESDNEDFGSYFTKRGINEDTFHISFDKIKKLLSKLLKEGNEKE